jgi:hypothetical protein
MTGKGTETTPCCLECGKVLIVTQTPLLYKRDTNQKICDPKSLGIAFWFERQEIRDVLERFLIRDAPKRVAEECIRRGITNPSLIISHQQEFGMFTPEDQNVLVEIAIKQYSAIKLIGKRERLSSIAIASWYRYAQLETDTIITQKINWSIVSFRVLNELGFNKKLCASILKKLVEK